MTASLIPGRRTRKRSVAPADTAVAYIRVSTGEQADSGAGLAAQRRALADYAERHGLTILEWHQDAAVSGGVAPAQRPGMSAALDTMSKRRAGVLIASKLDRVSRSVKDAAVLADQADQEGWSLRTADGTIGGDDSPMGRAMTGIASVFSELERELIATRTREALAELKAAGVQLGQPTKLADEVLTRIIGELSQGRSLRQIADGLMADDIPTATGREKWYPQQVKRAADSQRGQALAAAMFGEEVAA